MRFILIVSLIALVVSAVYFALPKPNNNIKVSAPISIESAKEESFLPVPATLSAKGVVVMDPQTGTIVAARNPHQRFMPASTTKMMTAIIALKNFDLNEVITITRSEDAIGKSTKFSLGEQYLVKDILKAALINSGNDAALSLADHYPGGYRAFVAQMNQQALSWGLKNTHFTNVSGVEEDNHYSSAADLAFIAKMVMADAEIAGIVNQPEGTITSVDGKYTHKFLSTNELLGNVPGVIGVKTGWTDNAGECLITYIDRDQDYIIVVLQSLDRFGETKKLIDWVYSDFGSATPGI